MSQRGQKPRPCWLQGVKKATKIIIDEMSHFFDCGQMASAAEDLMGPFGTDLRAFYDERQKYSPQIFVAIPSRNVYKLIG